MHFNGVNFVCELYFNKAVAIYIYICACVGVCVCVYDRLNMRSTSLSLNICKVENIVSPVISMN